MIKFTHESHAELVSEQAKEETKTKYMGGVKEHKTKLWQDYPIAQLVDNAIEESIDEGVYLRTVRMLLAELKSKSSALFELLEEPPEEELDIEAVELIDDIKDLLGL